MGGDGLQRAQIDTVRLLLEAGTERRVLNRKQVSPRTCMLCLPNRVVYAKKALTEREAHDACHSQDLRLNDDPARRPPRRPTCGLHVKMAVL